MFRLCSSMTWPHNPPDDLRYALETVLSYRSKGPVDLYAVFRDWAERHGVAPPRGAWRPGERLPQIYEDLEPRAPSDET